MTVQSRAFDRPGVLSVDLTEPLPDLPTTDGAALLVVLRAGSLPLGRLLLSPSELPLSAALLRRRAADAVAPAVRQRLLGHGTAAAPAVRASSDGLRDPLLRLGGHTSGPAGDGRPDGERFSVVVCTRGRPVQLVGALEALSALDPGPLEVVVVDNAPVDDEVRRVVDRFPGVRYARETRPGLSAARNAGVRASRGELIAFTDDDARPAPAWLAHLASAFDSDPRVGAVTGLVLPDELASDGARAFEQMGGLGRGFDVRDYDLAFFERHRRRTVPVWEFGAGANMAFRRRVLDLVGDFDERLGAGAAGCSEDSELWYRVVAAGFTCRYEPAAEVVHQHRADLEAVRRQARAYLRGHVAALAVQFARHRQLGELRRTVVSLPRHYGRRLLRSALPGSPPQPVLRAEVAGCLSGVREAVRILASDLRPTTGRRGGRERTRALLAQNPFPHPLTEGFYFREKMRAIARVAPDDQVRRVLEVGGGQSGLTSMLYPAADVVSVDLEPSFGTAAGNRRPGQAFLAADATRLPFADDAGDVVTYFDVLEHILEDRQAVQEALRVVAPGGSLLVTSPNEHWRFPYHGLLRRLCPRDVDVMAEWGHVRRGYTTADLERLVGLPVSRWATFIGPVTVVVHDLAFSLLPSRARRMLILALSPVTWAAYAAHRPHGRGTETAWWWRLPLVPSEVR